MHRHGAEGGVRSECHADIRMTDSPQSERRAWLQAVAPNRSIANQECWGSDRAEGPFPESDPATDRTNTA